MSDSPKLEQNKREYQYTSSGRVAIIGAFGGLIWGLLGYVAYLLNFTKYGPALILAPLSSVLQIKNDPVKQFTGIVAIIIVSIIIAFAYKVILGKIKTMWLSIGFGLVLWVLVFYILEPWIPGLEPVTKLDINTISTSLCLYALYGLFVGYSISYDLTAFDDSDLHEE
ncbi:MAG: YqhR family membrane protein [Tuberibacillus sp.]